MHLGYFGLVGYRELGKPPHEVFREHIEQVIHADRLGFQIAGQFTRRLPSAPFQNYHKILTNRHPSRASRYGGIVPGRPCF
jgi:hypothetical protein